MKCAATSLVCFLCFAASPATAQAVAHEDAPDAAQSLAYSAALPGDGYVTAEPAAQRFLGWAGGDLLAAPGSIKLRHVAYAGATVGAIALLTLADSTISRDAGVTNRQELGFVLDSANDFGDPVFLGPTVVGIFGATLLTNNSRLQDAAFTSLQSVLYTGVATQALKVSIGRARPRHLLGEEDFNPFGGHKSMPSGHTSLAFAATVPWAVYYPGPATYALVAVAGATGIARVARGDHWTSDAVAGAVLGTTFGYLLARRHQPGDSTGNNAVSFSAAPLVVPNGAGLSLSLRF